MQEKSNFSLDPFDLFYEWYLPVINTEKENSNAVVLSTSSGSGRVSSRVVLLKQHDRDGFVFFTNYDSRKGNNLAENIAAALLFYWPESRRQIRIEGHVERTSESESDSYFGSRKPGHMINAIVSEQSRPIESLEQYEQKMNSALSFYKDRVPERPKNWGGFRLVPDRFEFWEEGSNRFHTRIEYLYEDDFWSIRRLQP